jgi:microcystin degradation protein MlrC
MNKAAAELFIDAMIHLRELDASTGNDEPMRHQVRQLKQMAERAIEDACRLAINIAYLAKDLPEESRAIVADAIAATPSQEPHP